MLDSSIGFRFGFGFFSAFLPFAVLGGGRFKFYLSVRWSKRLCGFQGAVDTQVPNQTKSPMSKNAVGVGRKKFFKTLAYINKEHRNFMGLKKFFSHGF